jgi:hypothetical protein
MLHNFNRGRASYNMNQIQRPSPFYPSSSPPPTHLSPTHSVTHSISHPLTHSVTHSLTHSPTHLHVGRGTQQRLPLVRRVQTLQDGLEAREGGLQRLHMAEVHIRHISRAWTSKQITAQHSTLQHITAHYSTLQHSTAQHMR